MALTAKTQKKIEQAIKRFTNYLRFKSVGAHALSRAELKDLARSGMISSNGAPKTAIAKAYLKIHEQLASEPAPKTVREGAIDFLERMFTRYADKAGEGFSTDILNQIEANLMPIMDRTEGKAVYEILKDKEVHQKYLGQALKDTVENWSNRWKLIVNTELARASNYGALDAIIHNNKGADPSDILVYKIGGLIDGATCSSCGHFWYQSDGMTPKVYRLQELMANGSNVGKKRSEWLPTVDLSHPNCRHTVLQELKPGFGFDASGLITYKGKDHDELSHQNKSR